MEAILENAEGWQLNNLNIYWRAYERRYEATISFINRESENFSFKIPQHKVPALLALIADNVVDSAKSLGNRIAASVPVLLAGSAPALQDSESPKELSI